MNKFIVFGVLLAVVACQAYNNVEDSWYGKQEASCISQGGLCIAASECTQFVGRQGELCPEQAAQGFQCCFGLPKNDKRCSRRGGECFPKGYCKQQKLIYSEASDCTEEQDCCILT